MTAYSIFTICSMVKNYINQHNIASGDDCFRSITCSEIRKKTYANTNFFAVKKKKFFFFCCTAICCKSQR